MDLVTWGQGSGYFVLPRRDAEWVLSVASACDAIVWMTTTSQGFVQPLLMPRRWMH